MAKSREKTQQIGFWDAELASPDHDRICLWAYENAETIFRATHPGLFDRDWQQADIGSPIQGVELLSQAQAFCAANPRPNPQVARKTLEYVLKRNTGYQNRNEQIVGYADLILETSVPYIAPVFKEVEATNEPEWSPKRRREEITGFEVRWLRGREVPSILVEVKSAISSFGELMRQIQLYRTAFRGEVAVVSPDGRFAEILAEQGITFVRFVQNRA